MNDHSNDTSDVGGDTAGPGATGADSAPLVQRRPAPPSGARALVKGIVDALAMLVVLPGVVLYRLSVALMPSRKDTFYQGYSQCMSLWPGITGNFLRRAFYRLTLRSGAPNASIGFGTVFATPDVDLGDHVYIGVFCNVAQATIGRDTLLGSNVTILGGKKQHSFERLDVPIQYQAQAFSTVSVGMDVWIGNGSIIAEDVGDHAVVGAGSVVVKPVPPFAIVVGNPARIVGSRR
jgi:acetyltransferase-like isoleucine patch superfamily enzyme